jgi:hypothetical protein
MLAMCFFLPLDFSSPGVQNPRMKLFAFVAFVVLCGLVIVAAYNLDSVAVFLAKLCVSIGKAALKS